MIPLKKYRYIYKEREIERGAGLVPSGAPCCRRSERDGDEREKKKKRCWLPHLGVTAAEFSRDARRDPARELC